MTGSSAGPALSLTDSPWLADKVYEESFRDSGGISQEYVVNTYGFAQDTADYDGLPDARMVRQTATNTWQRTSTATSDTSTWRESEQQTIYDTTDEASADFGLPARAEDDGQIGVGSDNTCTTFGYAYNNDPADSRWMALPDEARHYGDTCANRSSSNQDSYSVTLYDGATSPATDVPVDGNPTEIDTYTSATTFKSVKHTYDQGGRVLSTTDGNGNTTTTTYTPVAGWPTGGVTTTSPVPDVAADDFHGATGSASALTTTTVSEPAYGNPISVSDSNGDVTTEQYDTAGRLINVWQPKDPTTGNPTDKYAYTTPDSGASETGTPDVVTGPSVTSSQRLQEISGGVQGYVASYTYLDGLGQTREVQSPAPDGSAGRDVVSTRYDSSGYSEGSSDPYYNSGAPGSGMVNPAVSALPAYHDAIVDWEGRITEAQLDHDGTALLAGDVKTTYFPDYTQVTDADGNVTKTSLNIFGKPTSIAQQTPGLYGSNTPANTVTTSYGYDDKQQLISVTDAGGNVSSYSYDWAGQQTASSSPNAGRSCTYYDGAGNPQYVDANAPATCPADPTTLASRITTVYDALERPTSLWQGAPGTGTALTSDTYDTAPLGKGAIASAVSYAGGGTYTTSADGYDKDGNSLGSTVTIPASAGFTATSFDTQTTSYDSAGDPLTLSYPAAGTGSSALPAETVTVGYNNAGSPTTLTSNITGTSSYATDTWTNYGPLASRTYGSGTLTASRLYSWDQATGWLTNISTTVTSNGTPATAQNDTYGYDNNGDVTEIASAAGAAGPAQQQCFGYDPLNRLTTAFTTTTATVPTTVVAGCGTASASHTGGTAPYDLTYSYDQLGNIASVADKVAGTTATYSYAANGTTIPGGPSAVTKVVHSNTATGAVTGTDTYGYDANGNMTSRSVGGVAATMTYDPQQQMSAFTAGGAADGYVYDSSGSLLLRSGPSGSTLYLPGEEISLAGGVVTPTRYYNLNGSQVAMRVGGGGATGTLTWLAADGQRSTQVAISAASGTVTRQLYLPYGGQRGPQGPTPGTQRGYLDQAFDPATALLQDGARFYDPSLGRFLSPDELVTPTVPADLDSYSYGYDNPETNSDPSGLYVLGPGGSPSCPSGIPGHCDTNYSPDPNGGNNGSSTSSTTTTPTNTTSNNITTIGKTTVTTITFQNGAHLTISSTTIIEQYYQCHTGEICIAPAGMNVICNGGSGACLVQSGTRIAVIFPVTPPAISNDSLMSDMSNYGQVSAFAGGLLLGAIGCFTTVEFGCLEGAAGGAALGGGIGLDLGAAHHSSVRDDALSGALSNQQIMALQNYVFRDTLPDRTKVNAAKAQWHKPAVVIGQPAWNP